MARFTRSKAIRIHCKDCMCGNMAEVARCDDLQCSLWEYRFGKNPTKEMVEQAKDELVLKGRGYPEKP